MPEWPEPRDVRLEADSLGPVEVPRDALYGAHTVRAIANFAVSGVLLSDRPTLLVAFAQTKAAAARANELAGIVEPRIAAAIVAAAHEIAGGAHHDEFPIDVTQGGGGTATNMNVNEVLANRAAVLLGGEPGRYDVVHPNDHVNRSQSTNDVYPTALAIATIRGGREASSAFRHLAGELDRKGREHNGWERLGRTCLQDALPVPIAAWHGAQARALRRLADDLDVALQRLVEVPLGATAVGTGLGAGPRYRADVVPILCEETGLALRRAEDPFDLLAHHDPYLGVAGDLARVATLLGQLAADFRLLASGPVGGIGELRLPAVQVGSSQMPAKVNPAIPELVLQVSFEVRGARSIVEEAVAAGELDLNVMEPLIARHLLGALSDGAIVARTFADRCVAGLQWAPDALAANLRGSRAQLVELAAERGYEEAARRGAPAEAADGIDRPWRTM